MDGAIHRIGGPDLLEACWRLGGCPTGKAKITKGFRLPARFIIHTVGPGWKEGTRNEEELLADCYRNSLKLALDNDCKTIAFPNISTGAYRFPKDLAAKIAVQEVSQFLENNLLPELVTFVCFDPENFEIY